MKKRGTGLLAALVCALLLAALLPAPASAAGGQTPAAAAAAADRTAARVKASGSQTVRIGKWYSMSVPLNYTVGGKPVSVKFQWQVKKGSGKPYVNVKGAAGNTYCFKATKGKDGRAVLLLFLDAEGAKVRARLTGTESCDMLSP